MLSDVANILLFLAGLTVLYAIICYLIGLRKARADFILSGFRGIIATFALITICAVILFILLIAGDFSNSYVAAYTSTGLPLPYVISAFWAGQDGSLFFWLWALSIISLIAIAHRRKEVLTSYASVILLFVQLFLIIVVYSLGNPFRRLPTAPLDGAGLNPLLRNIYMISHPPTVFIAYAGFTVPFAFALASLFRKESHSEWIARSRPWLLISWIFLGIGIILGAKWAYVVLGWGGYWAWDPVENAALIPWLIATPLLHSAIMEERKGIFKLWNKFLILFTFELCVFGTFITRSGILSSVHAFAESNIGVYFLLFIILSTFFYLLLLFIRMPQQKSEHTVSSIFSKEGFSILNNLLFCVAALIVLFGTTFPLISGLFSRKITLGPPFFNQALSPLALILLLLTGLCTVLPWKRATKRAVLIKLIPSLCIPFLLIVILFITGIRNGWALLTFFLSSFIIVGIITEFIKRQNPLKNRRRLGAAIVHLGAALIAIGIVGSTFFKQESKVVLPKGESTVIGTFKIRYDTINEIESLDAYRFAVLLTIEKKGRYAGTLSPAKVFYPNTREPYSEIAVRSSLIEDLYIIFAGITEDESVSLHIYRNPLICWIWWGSLLFALGTVVALLHKRQQKPARAPDDLIERLVKEERDSKEQERQMKQ
jgi:cytochrome c-type biogenesis protein CcmF